MLQLKLNRRDVLNIGLLSGIGLGLDRYLELKADDKISSKAKAQSVIYIYLPGGFSAQETFDPKPLAPIEYRGPFSSINTSIPGIRFNENLKETAKIADKLTVIRSMTHNESAHERGANNMFTGWRPSPSLEYPSLGSIVSHELGASKNLPPYISIPNPANEYAGSGYLSNSYSSFGIGGNPEDPKFKVRDLTIPSNIDNQRFENRKRLLGVVNNSNFVRSNQDKDVLQAVSSFYDSAFGLMTSQQAIDAFDLSKETDKTKSLYGTNAAGMRMLLSRRLVEAGVRFVSMTYGGWDMHNNIINGINTQLPPFDKAYAALISDLEDRGLLESTTVVVASEFGRTPKLNKDAGRDHWPKVFSSVLAGGGIKRGLAYGASDATSNDVESDPVTPEAWAATIYHLLGIDYTKALLAPGGRPVKIIDGAKHIEEIII